MTWLSGPENDYTEISDLPDPSPTLRAAVVIPVYNRVALLARTVAALVPQTYPSRLVSVVVADDGSEEDVAAALAPFSSRLDLTLVRREHDGYGAGQARNLGAAATTAEVLVFVDADCVPDPDLVARHARWHHLAENLVVIGSRHPVDTTAIETGALADGKSDLRSLAFGEPNPGEEAFRPSDNRAVLHRRTAGQRAGNEAFRSLVSSNFSIRADRFAESGGFSPDFHRWGGEDIELGWRLWNEGMFFVPDDLAACYHQIQDDALGTEGRMTSKDLNAGVIASKVPHRFYRHEVHGPIHEVPKVSWVIAPSDDRTSARMFDRLIRHHYLDTEVVFAAPGPETTLLAERYAGDPRFNVAGTAGEGQTAVAAAILAARGEYVALLHGDAVPDRRLLTRTLRRIEAAPRVARMSVGYRVGFGEAARNHRSRRDVARLDAAWGPGSLPVFSLSTRREWVKAIRATSDLDSAWDLLCRQTRAEHLTDELVTLPTEAPDAAPPDRVPELESDRYALTFDLRGAATLRSVASALVRFLVARVTRRPYTRRRHTDGPEGSSERDASSAPPLEPAPAARREPTRDRPRIRYVGWTGHDNLGDEAMLLAAAELFEWGDVETSHRGDLLLLGGGTLINRANYLEWLIRHDSPRIERAVFGTGVAHPDFWGQREPAEGWARFLESCAFVGVRGPESLRILRSWGFTGSARVVGDPALALSVSDAPARVPGRAVVSPAWTGGELWGGSDQVVLAAMADLVKRLAAEGRDVVMLSCFPGDDRHIFEMMRAAGVPELPYVAGYDNVRGALRLLASAEVVVAERLHAAVLAAAAGSPFVAVEYRPKVADFAASVDMQDFVVRSDAITTDGLAELVAAATRDAAAVSARIDERVAVYRKRLAAASATLEGVVHPSGGASMSSGGAR